MHINNTQRSRIRNTQFKNWDYDSAPPVYYRRTPKSFLASKPKFSLILYFKKVCSAVWDLFYFITVFCKKSKIFLLATLAVVGMLLWTYFNQDKSKEIALEESNMILNLNNNVGLPGIKAEPPKSAAVFAAKGDTLVSVLKQLGLPGYDINNIQRVSNHEPITKGRKVKNEVQEKADKNTASSPKIAVALGDLIELDLTTKDLSLAFHSKDNLVTVRKIAGGNYVVEKVKVSRVDREGVALGQITTNFREAAKRAGLSPATADNLVDLFDTRVNFSKLQYGDKFTVIVSASQLEDGRVLKGNDILAAAISYNGKDYMAVRYVGTDGKTKYFDESGSIIGDFFLRYPVKFSRISSIFSNSRLHPILKIRRPHNGIDFAAPTGTPVRAAGDGVVIKAGKDGTRGNYIYIQHSKRYMTNYYHLSKIDKSVKRGGQVKRGQIIGAVGTTGLSTGPHLHYGFFDNGKFVNPLTIKLPTLDTMDKGNRINESYLRKVVFTLENYQNQRGNE